MDDLKARFHSVARYLMPVRIVKDEPPPVDREAALANDIQVWAADDTCSDLFLPWIEARIEQVELEETASIRSHPDLCYQKGRKGELLFIRDQFRKWAGTTRKDAS